MPDSLYFAYGSNLDQRQMRRRCPSAAYVGPAKLSGYRLAFAGHSRMWDGPVATAIRDPRADLDGVLYQLPRAELVILDRYEGHPRFYQRERVAVRDERNRRRIAHVYFLRLHEAEKPPPRKYVSTLRQAYRHLGFDPEVLLAAGGGGR